MSKQERKGLVPELRFPEFAGAQEWQFKPLDKHADKVGSGITPTGGEKIYTKEGRIFVRSQNVGWGTLMLDDVAYIDEETHQSFPATEIHLNDVLINLTGASIGRCAIADERVAGGNVNQHVCIIRTTEKLDPTYLEQFILCQQGQGQIDSFQAGGNRQGLNFAQIRSLSIPFPPSKDEQKKIAACLSSLDALLAAEREKLEALRAHKKGLLQQLFPAEGAKVPVRRFPGFKGSWGAEPLGKFTSKVGSGITPRGGDKTYLQEGRIFVRSQNIGWGVLLLDEVAYIDEETHQMFPGTEIQLSDVLLNLSGASIGRCAVANDRLVGGNVNQHVCIIRVNDDIHPVYLEQFILSKPGQKQVDSFQAGGNRQGLNYDQVRSFTIPLPSGPDEQEVIASCLSSLDERIALQTERIAALIDHKKGLMQGLFPG